jgi:hypothetical protein
VDRTIRIFRCRLTGLCEPIELQTALTGSSLRRFIMAKGHWLVGEDGCRCPKWHQCVKPDEEGCETCDEHFSNFSSMEESLDYVVQSAPECHGCCPCGWDD